MSHPSNEIVSNGDPHGNGGSPEFMDPLPEAPAQPAAPEVAANRMEAAAERGKKRGRKPGGKDKPKEDAADGATVFNFGANVKPGEPAGPPAPPVKTADGAGGPDEHLNPFDPRSYRGISPEGALDVKRTVTVCPVRKPPKGQFVMTHPDPTFTFLAPCLEVELSDCKGKETYLLAPWMAKKEELVRDRTFKWVHLTAAITQSNDVFLWDLTVIPDGRARLWYTTGLEAKAFARDKWTRVDPNMGLGAYEFRESARKLPPPVWPEGITMTDLLLKGFRDRFVDSDTHPVVRRLRGEA
jgi:hypothetical protein